MCDVVFKHQIPVTSPTLHPHTHQGDSTVCPAVSAGSCRPPTTPRRLHPLAHCSLAGGAFSSRAKFQTLLSRTHTPHTHPQLAATVFSQSPCSFFWHLHASLKLVSRHSRHKQTMSGRPAVVGADAGPEAPYPLQMEGKVISGFGRGSKEVITLNPPLFPSRVFGPRNALTHNRSSASPPPTSP